MASKASLPDPCTQPSDHLSHSGVRGFLIHVLAHSRYRSAAQCQSPVCTPTTTSRVFSPPRSHQCVRTHTQVDGRVAFGRRAFHLRGGQLLVQERDVQAAFRVAQVQPSHAAATQVRGVPDFVACRRLDAPAAGARDHTLVVAEVADRGVAQQREVDTDDLLARCGCRPCIASDRAPSRRPSCARAPVLGRSSAVWSMVRTRPLPFTLWKRNFSGAITVCCVAPGLRTAKPTNGALHVQGSDSRARGPVPDAGQTPGTACDRDPVMSVLDGQLRHRAASA